MDSVKQRRGPYAKRGKGAALAVVAATLALSATVAASGAPAAPAAVVPPPLALSAAHVVLSVPPGAIAEATAAIDPRDSHRMAVAADPYLAPTRIELSVSTDGGAHWPAATDVLPPGMSKSYDPQLAFTAGGTLLVVGGASPDTRSGCQAGSEIFLAVVRSGQIGYHVIAAAAPGELLDRPTLVVNAAGRIVTAWTASTGPGAVCALRPQSAATQVAALSTDLQTSAVTTLRPIAPAPFGSAMAVNGNGTLGLVVAARGAAATQHIVVYESRDAAHWSVAQVGTGQAQPDNLAGLGGAVLAMPTITGLPDGFAVAWTDASSGTARTRLTLENGGNWTEVAAPPASSAALLPTIGAQAGTIFLTQATRAPADLQFNTWQRSGGGWDPIAHDSSGPIAARHELGEALGLAVTQAGAYLTAVPVDTGASSALLVRTHTPPPPVTASGAHPAATPDASSSRTRGGHGTLIGLLATAGTTAALTALAFIRRRRRARGGSGG